MLIEPSGVGSTGVYHANDPVEWPGTTGFYYTDYRSPLERNESETWHSLFVWAATSYPGENMFLSFEPEVLACGRSELPITFPPSDRRYLLELVTVPDGVTGGPAVGTVWELSADGLFTVELPTYRTTDGLTGYELSFTVSEAEASPGDFDNDGDVDQDDYEVFEPCFTGPGVQVEPGCELGDFDGDADIDCDDWEQFVPAWTGPGDAPGLPMCALPIPTVSEWGMVLFALLILIAGTLVQSRLRSLQVWV